MLLALRPVIPLLIGLTIGAAGAILFIQSLPPEEGSAKEKVEKLEAELKRANKQLAAHEALDPHGRRRPGRTLKDGARGIAEDLRDGKPVTPDDVFRAMQPLMRDLNPLFSRMRLRDQERRIDSMTGELARKYSLNSSQQESLKIWLKQNAAEQGENFDRLMLQDGVRFEEFIEASRDIRPDDGLEKFMEKTLVGEKLAAFKTDRMLERVERVQREADMKVTRLDDIVGLDDSQRGEVFGVMARGAPDFDPAMGFEGLGSDSAALTSGQSKQEAILAILRPDQREAYKAERERRRAESQKDLEAIGLSMPESWDALDPFNF
jgi:hypothetical protein